MQNDPTMLKIREELRRFDNCALGVRRLSRVCSHEVAASVPTSKPIQELRVTSVLNAGVKVGYDACAIAVVAWKLSA